MVRPVHGAVVVVEKLKLIIRNANLECLNLDFSSQYTNFNYLEITANFLIKIRKLNKKLANDANITNLFNFTTHLLLQNIVTQN